MKRALMMGLLLVGLISISLVQTVPKQVDNDVGIELMFSQGVDDFTMVAVAPSMEIENPIWVDIYEFANIFQDVGTVAGIDNSQATPTQMKSNDAVMPDPVAEGLFRLDIGERVQMNLSYTRASLDDIVNEGLYRLDIGETVVVRNNQRSTRTG